MEKHEPYIAVRRRRDLERLRVPFDALRLRDRLRVDFGRDLDLPPGFMAPAPRARPLL